MTDRLAQACSQLLHSSNIKAIAPFFDLGWHTVNSIDKAFLLATTAQPQLDRIEYLAMDEFALQKGHGYATMVVDPISRQVLWVGKGAHVRRHVSSSSNCLMALPSVSARLPST